jgi:hypothetical protein
LQLATSDVVQACMHSKVSSLNRPVKPSPPCPLPRNFLPCGANKSSPAASEAMPCEVSSSPFCMRMFSGHVQIRTSFLLVSVIFSSSPRVVQPDFPRRGADRSIPGRSATHVHERIGLRTHANLARSKPRMFYIHERLRM